MTPARFRKLKLTLLRRQHDLTVFADGIHKSHNVSALLRSCDAVGIARLHTVSAHECLQRHDTIAGGSKRWVGIATHRTTEAAFAALREEGMQILAAHAGPGANDFRDLDYTRPTAIVLGAELAGPSEYALAHADRAIGIPMHGLVDSLNVSVAAAVILFEAERQRSAAGSYRRPPPDREAFTRTLFEWAYPEIAERCRELETPYPDLDENGELTSNPFAERQP